MKIAGRATVEGTRRLLERAGGAPGWSRILGRTGLAVSAVGFGGYRISDTGETHRQALRRALTAGGINLIDTSTNYGLGASERLVGRVLSEAIEAGELRRDEVVVVTKVGYWQGPMLDDLRREADAEGALPWTVARQSPDHWHAVDPALLRRALDVSRERTGLAHADIVLLHNPEYLLGEMAPAAFYDHLADAFAELEALVGEGRIGAYGVSSNTLVRPPDEPRATSLSRLLDAARRAGGAGHHLAVVQLPLNPLERGAETRWGDAPSVLERCADQGVAVLVNRPLNALHDGRLVRLADPGDVSAAGDFAEARRALAALEEEGPEGSGSDGVPRWSRELPRALRGLASAVDFDDFRARYTEPRTEEGLACLGAPPEWSERYRRAWARLLTASRAQLALRDRRRLEPVFAELQPELPGSVRDASWAQQAVAWSATRRGATTVLVGMRRPAYVDDVGALRRASLSGAAVNP